MTVWVLLIVISLMQTFLLNRNDLTGILTNSESQEIEKLINAAQDCAEHILRENREILEALANSLVEEETLDQERLKKFFEQWTVALADKSVDAKQEGDEY